MLPVLYWPLWYRQEETQFLVSKPVCQTTACTEKLQRFLNSQCLDNMANWAKMQESKCSFHMRWKQQGPRLPSYFHALRATGLDMMRLFCQHLKLSLGLFSKLMMSHNLSLKRPLWKITKASSFLRNYCGWWSSSLWTFTTATYSSPPTINPTPTSLLKLRADYITLFTSNYLLSLLQLPKGFSLHQQVLWITKVNKWIGTTRLE